MKKHLIRILVTALALALICGTVPAGRFGEAAADGEKTFTEWKEQLLTTPSFKFQRRKEGIGRGDCPVYTAPVEGAYRFANNRQACDTNKDMYEGGRTEDGWLLVRYDTGNGNVRVGYIPPKYVQGVKSSMGTRKFDRISAVAADTIYVTDNPLKGGKTFCELGSGEPFVILAKYTYNGNWWYIECTADGKTARGFIDRDSSKFYPGSDVADNLNQTPVSMENIGTPSVSPMGTTQIGTVLINGSQNDERKRVHKDANAESKWISVVYPTKTYPCYGTKNGSNGKAWYYVFIERDSLFGWIYSGFSTLQN